MNRLAKKSLTASVLLTMILSLMPAIRAKADGYIVQAVDSTIPSSNENGQGSIRDAMFQVNAEGGIPAFCLNFTYKAPPGGAGQDKYTQYTVKRDDIDTYVGSSYRRASGEDLYKRLMTILYYGYKGKGEGKDQTIASLLAQKSDYKDDLFRIATQYAIWYYTDSLNNQDFNDEAETPKTFKDYMKNRTGLSESDLNLASQIYERLISSGLGLPQDFKEQDHELVIYKGTKVDQLGSVKPGTRWQNMITSRSIQERPSQPFEFSKTDVNGTAELWGAKLRITDKSGNKTYDEWTSDGSVHKVKLHAGEYTMVETTAPDGYETAEKIPFEVVEVDGALKIKDRDNGRLVMQDKPKDKQVPWINISKRELNATKKTLVGGAQLTITENKYYPKGEGGQNDSVDRGTNGVKFVIDTLTDKDRVVNLYYGEYILSETTKPKGYQVAQPIVFRVIKTDKEPYYKVQVEKGKDDFVDSEEATTVIMYDEKEPSTPPNTPPNNPNTPPTPNTPPDKPNTPPNPNTPPTPNTPPNTPQNPNNGHSAPQVAGAKRSEPGTPGTPGTPVPPSDGGHVPGVAGAQRSPETADATPIALLLGVMSIAAAGLGIFMHKWKKLG